VNPHIIRNGQRIEVETLDTGIVPKKRREPFKAQWVKLPRWWIEVLRRTKSASTKQLAMEILSEVFKREQIGGEIVLSATVTKLLHSTRMRAAKELVELGLIKTEQKGRQAMRVSHVYYYNKNRE
jgi:hypothetical protein